MDGENTMNVGIAIELAVNFVQQLMFIGFLYLFFDKPKSKAKRMIPFWMTVILMFALATYFTTFNESFFSYLDSVIVITVMLLYTLLFLKGKLYLRIIMPIAIIALYMLVVFTLQFTISVLGKTDFEETVTYSNAFRYLYLFTGNFVYGILLFIILRFKKGKIYINSVSDILAFIVIPLVTCFVSMTTLLAFKTVDFNKNVQIHFTAIIIGIALMTAVFWYLLIRISRDSHVKTELLLSKQREELYRDSIVSTNEQIEKISTMKHDVKNNLMSVSVLIDEGQYKTAKALCDDYNERLTVVHTPVHTGNPVLNAIINVEIEKAESQSVDFSYEINDDLSFVTDSDVISVIGNLCDNAIEYLSTIPEHKRQMQLAVKVYRDYYCITCQNTILSSVLNTNPDLNSTKDNVAFHGKGLKILKNVAEKYQGELIYSEEENEFVVSTIIRNKN